MTGLAIGALVAGALILGFFLGVPFGRSVRSSKDINEAGKRHRPGKAPLCQLCLGRFYATNRGLAFDRELDHRLRKRKARQAVGKSVRIHKTTAVGPSEVSLSSISELADIPILTEADLTPPDRRGWLGRWIAKLSGDGRGWGR